MDSSRERTCPSCSAPAEPKQRWCLECGSELRSSRRPALRSAVGIATTLTVLVGAASAGGYTLLQDGKEPPPPVQTIAQVPPPVPTTPTTPTPAPDTTVPPLPNEPTPLPDTGGGDRSATPAPAPTPAPSYDAPDLSGDLDTSSPPPPPPSDDTELDDDGSVTDGGGDRQDRVERPAKPRPRETDLGRGLTTIVYAPYAPGDFDPGDPSAVMDGTTRTSWKTPRFEDPATNPQMGVMVDFAGLERLRTLTIKTPTPGFGVEIYATKRSVPPGSITAPGWSHLTDVSDLGADETIPLPSGRFRHLLIWVVSLPPGGDQAAISEVAVTAMRSE